ncbi:hypothetical protein [Herbiconiux liangxiaofengii]|uniref:hypothetical protein n=1 Tax=Herbiconiux liangxiaofengii TaxID=3342795 RepID=UPI0035B9C1E5
MIESTSPSPGSLTALASALDGDGSSPVAPGDEIELIARADELSRLSQARLYELVAVARDRGIPWPAIGAALGVSRQAAFKRFGAAGQDKPGAEGVTIDLIDRTVAVFQALDADDYDAVKAHMTYACARALSKRRVMQMWSTVVASSGRLEGCDDSTVQTPDGRSALGKLANRHLLTGAVVQTTLRHEAGEWLARVAYNGSGRITGLLVAPPGARDLAF